MSRLARGVVVAAVTVIVVITGCDQDARAEGGTPRQAAHEAFARAESAAKELRFAEALGAYEEAAAADPTAPFAPTARARAEDLRAHSEGGFGPLARLAAVRRDPAKNRDAREIDALLADARGFPDGRVRAEAMLVVAQAYAHALGQPDRAIEALEAILGDEYAERTIRTLALAEVVTLHKDRGDLAGARRAVGRDPALLPSLTHEVMVLVRRVWIARGCLALLLALAALGAWGAARGAKRLGDARKVVPLVVRPGALGLAFYIGAGGAIFVRVHGGEGDPMPFLGLGLGVALIGVLARSWALAEARPSRRGAAIRAVVAGAGVLAAAYLILWKVSGDFLTPIGL